MLFYRTRPRPTLQLLNCGAQTALIMRSLTPHYRQATDLLSDPSSQLSQQHHGVSSKSQHRSPCSFHWAISVTRANHRRSRSGSRSFIARTTLAKRTSLADRERQKGIDAKGDDLREVQKMLSFVSVDTYVVAHARQRWYCLTLTSHQDITVPKHSIHGIPFTTAHFQSW